MVKYTWNTDIIEKLYNIGHKPIVFMSETNQKKSVSIKSVYVHRCQI